MRLRTLREADAEKMLAWMHDPEVVRDLHGRFAERTLEDCRVFIRNSEESGEDVHLAVADERDEYMGTVSLKHMNARTRSAEFAIVVCREAMGKGYAWFAMEEILRKAFMDYGMETVYWCVSPRNGRAVRFYTRHNFRTLAAPPAEADPDLASVKELIWYQMRRGENGR